MAEPDQFGGAFTRRHAKSENIVRVPLPFRSYLRVRTFVYRLLNPTHQLQDEGRQLGIHGANYIGGFLPRWEKKKIEALNEGANTYLVVKHLPTAGLFFPNPSERLFRDMSPAGRKKLAAKLSKRLWHSEMMLAGLARMLGCKIKRRYEMMGQEVGRDLRTAPDEPQVSDRDGADMPLRFHQCTVEFQMPTELNRSTAGHESCRYQIYLCLKNRRALPVHILPVREVIAEICRNDPAKRARVLEELQQPHFQKTGPTWGQTVEKQSIEGVILHREMRADGSDDWRMCFDPERVKAASLGTGAHDAVHELRSAILRLRNKAVHVALERGDVLIVDNQRALVTRREHYPVQLGDVLRTAMFFRPRWLRLYYAFRGEDEGEPGRFFIKTVAVSEAEARAALPAR